MNVVVTPSARETFTPREIAAAYEQFEVIGPQHLDAETGIKVRRCGHGECCRKAREEVAVVLAFGHSL